MDDEGTDSLVVKKQKFIFLDKMEGSYFERKREEDEQEKKNRFKNKKQTKKKQPKP
ncbi:MAG: hypothetical protein ABIH11_07405 [Candidatus Altiarchaeota archaeon]